MIKRNKQIGMILFCNNLKVIQSHKNKIQTKILKFKLFKKEKDYKLKNNSGDFNLWMTSIKKLKIKMNKIIQIKRTQFI